jgi:hypothetical protein
MSKGCRWGEYQGHEHYPREGTHVVVHSDSACPCDEGHEFCEEHAQAMIDFWGQGVTCKMTVRPVQ